MTKQEEPIWTIHRLLDWTTTFFQEHGLPTPRLDAEILLAHLLQQERLDLYLHYEEALSRHDLATYRALIQRRRQWEPIAYITGKREFFSISFVVNPAVLIPRPETEHLIEYALDYLRGHILPTGKPVLSILEIGTGSGNVCITLAKHLPQARIISIDICDNALNVAKKNMDTYAHFCDSVFLIQGDLLSCLHRERAKFDLIVSNPPYISEESMETLPEEVKRYEPARALNGGRQGNKIMETILDQAGQYLFDKGLLAMEIGEGQADGLLQKASLTAHYRKSWVLPDYAGKPRVLMAVT